MANYEFENHFQSSAPGLDLHRCPPDLTCAYPAGAAQLTTRSVR
jgi:hypothetical protein